MILKVLYSQRSEYDDNSFFNPYNLSFKDDKSRMKDAQVETSEERLSPVYNQEEG